MGKTRVALRWEFAVSGWTGNAAEAGKGWDRKEKEDQLLILQQATTTASSGGSIRECVGEQGGLALLGGRSASWKKFRIRNCQFSIYYVNENKTKINKQKKVGGIWYQSDPKYKNHFNPLLIYKRFLYSRSKWCVFWPKAQKTTFFDMYIRTYIGKIVKCLSRRNVVMSHTIFIKPVLVWNLNSGRSWKKGRFSP